MMKTMTVPEELMQKLRDPSIREGCEPYYATIERCLKAYVYLSERRRAVTETAIMLDPILRGTWPCLKA